MIFYCLHCDSSRDSDHDAECGPDPDNAQYLICGECLADQEDDPEVDMADMIYAHNLELSL